jgi:hypothetical protein
MRTAYALLVAVSALVSLPAYAAEVCDTNCIGPLCNKNCVREPGREGAVIEERRKPDVVIEERDRRREPEVDVRIKR